MLILGECLFTSWKPGYTNINALAKGRFENLNIERGDMAYAFMKGMLCSALPPHDILDKCRA